MAESVDTTGPADEPTTPLWEHLKDDVVAAFGEDAEITVRHYSNHIEVSVIPAHVEATLERNYDGVTAVPYHAFQMTIRNDD